MWAYIFRRLLYNVPVFLGIILFVMAALRVNDPIYGFLGKNATQERYDNFKKEFDKARALLNEMVDLPDPPDHAVDHQAWLVRAGELLSDLPGL